jgi:hypothetical protein
MSQSEITIPSAYGMDWGYVLDKIIQIKAAINLYDPAGTGQSLDEEMALIELQFGGRILIS